MTTPTITPLETADFQSIDPCIDSTMPEHEMAGRLVVDISFNGVSEFHGETTEGDGLDIIMEDGHWAVEYGNFNDNGTPDDPSDDTPAPLEVGTHNIAVRCLPLDADEPAQNYVALSFTVAEAAAPAPTPTPPPATPVVDDPPFTG